MKTIRNKKGFTLAELLIVVAIIAVLVAIAVPVFSGIAQDAEEKVELANIRAARAEAAADYLLNGRSGVIEYKFEVSGTGDITFKEAKEVESAGEDDYTSGTVTVYIKGTDVNKEITVTPKATP